MESCSKLKFRSIFAFCLWAIWHLRNNFYFRNKQATIQATCQKAVTSFNEYAYIHFPEAHSPSNTSGICWEPPPTCWVKLNSDGAFVEGAKCGGAGYLLRDSQGSLIFAGTLKHCGSSSIDLEAWGILEGIKRCRGTDYSIIIIEIDSDLLRAIICGERHRPWCIYQIIDDIFYHLHFFPDWRIYHCYRRANMAADFLAHFGNTCTNDVFWESNPPQGILQLLYKDFWSFR